MTQRITITLPDELYNCLKGVKGRINVSKTCQEAILREVTMLEASKSTDLIEFLIAGKGERADGYRKAGYDTAVSDVNARHIDYKLFLQITGIADYVEKYPDQVYKSLKDATDIYAVCYGFWYKMEEVMKNRQREDKGFNSDAFLCGYVKGIADMWNELKDKI